MSETKPLLDPLIPEYENVALEALDARDEWLATAARCCDRAVIAAARDNWAELERQRVAILDALETLAEQRIAMRLRQLTAIRHARYG